MREAEAAWRFGVTVREYRELEAGTRFPTVETWNRICKLYGWPQTFVSAT
jgi:Helix-turn-helix domain